MATFLELQTHLDALRNKRTILAHLVEHLDAQFMPELDATPKMVLLTETKVKVPPESFDAVATDLNSWIKALLAEEQKLLSSTVAITPPPPPPEPVEEEKVPEPEPSEAKS